MTEPTLFNQILVWPITNLLMVFYKPLAVLGVPGALGFSIILLTAFIRLLLYPLNLKQLRSAKDMQKLKPQIDKLVKKHKKNKKKLQEEQLKLYQKHGINPAAGCLPTLLQMPILIGLYRVLLQVLGNGNISELVSDINKIVYIPLFRIQELSPDFFGINIGIKPSDWKNNGIWILLIPVLTAALSYLQTRVMQYEDKTEKSKNKTDKKNAEKEEDFSAVMQSQMKFMFPLMIGFISYSFPIGLALYWNTFTIFGIIQQIHVRKER